MKHWISAFRLRTLPLAVSSILVGSALAHYHGVFQWPVFVLALLTAVLLQILSNLANDLGDHQHGTDNAQRIGPQRAVQSGAISPAAMKRAMILCGVLAFASGCALIVVAFGLSITTLVFLLLGLAAIAAAVKYTFGKNPYGYAGLGDLSVFVFFGLVGVGGTYFAHARVLPLTVLPGAIAFGMLSTAVLNLNNMRDIENDARSGKRTLAVRLGRSNARVYHYVLLAIGGAGALIVAFTHLRPAKAYSMLVWIAVLLLPHAYRVWRSSDPVQLDPELKRLAIGTFILAIFFFLYS
jgi:1,4-dihydroxy-2-naphthoate polyprenyltransferase